MARKVKSLWQGLNKNRKHRSHRSKDKGIHLGSFTDHKGRKIKRLILERKRKEFEEKE